MQFHIESPPPIEAVEILSSPTSLTIRPLTVKGQHIVRAGYVTASGNNGTMAKAVLLFNANTGEFSVQRLDGAPVAFDFDKPPTEFAAKRAAAKKANLEKLKGGGSSTTPPVEKQRDNASH